MENVKKCAWCGRRLRKFEIVSCEECEENLEDTFKKKNLTHVSASSIANYVNDNYVSKTKLRRIINDYSTPTKRGRVIPSDDYREFVFEITKLVGYKPIE